MQVSRGEFQYENHETGKIDCPGQGSFYTFPMNALILLAPGCEEMEAVIVIDTLRRGGVRVVAAGLEAGPLTASRGVVLVPDLPLDAVEDAKNFQMLILPGGLPGTKALQADPRVRDLLAAYLNDPAKTVAAICAAPTVLDGFGWLDGREFTCYPGQRGALVSAAGWRPQEVVEDGNLITSQGPGTSFRFALALLRRLAGEAAAREVARGMLVQD
jgi:4-methyl-5(b-hydroxyethyl)-thiazole monophosphate biosynthesis